MKNSRFWSNSIALIGYLLLVAGVFQYQSVPSMVGVLTIMGYVMVVTSTLVGSKASHYNIAKVSVKEIGLAQATFDVVRLLVIIIGFLGAVVLGLLANATRFTF